MDEFPILYEKSIVKLLKDFVRKVKEKRKRNQVSGHYLKGLNTRIVKSKLKEYKYTSF